MSSVIVVFAFKRPEHLRQTLVSLSQNSGAQDSKVVIYCDGARSESEAVAVASARAVAEECYSFASIEVIHRDENYGLSKSIISGVTEQLEKYEQIIVLEDDIVTSPYFLKYMNEALELYKDDKQVISIHGYIYPIQTPLPETFFLRGADCWGWATWRRGWACFNSNGSYLLDELKNQDLLSKFDMDGAYSFSKMLENQINGLNDSWAVRWHASAFLRNYLTLYPSRSLVQNIGNDNSGTHSGKTSRYDVSISPSPIKVHRVPLEECDFALKEIKQYLLQTQAPTRLRRIGLNNFIKLFNFTNFFKVDNHINNAQK